MTTRLGADTNLSCRSTSAMTVAGNPVNPDGGDLVLRERVLQRDNWLQIIERFINVQTSEKIGPGHRGSTRSRQIIFPRFHPRGGSHRTSVGHAPRVSTATSSSTGRIREDQFHLLAGLLAGQLSTTTPIPAFSTRSSWSPTGQSLDDQLQKAIDRRHPRNGRNDQRR